MIRQRAFLIACVALLWMAGTAMALDSVQLGTPIQVNTTFEGYSAYLRNGDFDVGMADNGDFVCAYFRTDGASGGIWKRAFNADGTAKDPLDVAVNTTVNDDQACVSLGVRKDGTYDIAWGSYGQPLTGYSSNVMRGFNADGSQRYGEVVVQTAVPVAMPDDPDYAWNGPGENTRAWPAVAVYNNADPETGVLLAGGNYQHNVYPALVAKDGTVLFSQNPEFDGVNVMTYVQYAGWNAHYGVKAAAVMDNGDGVFFSGDGHDQDPNNLRAKYVVFDRSVGTDGEFEPTSKFEQGLDASTLGNASGKLIGSPERWRCDVAMNGTGSGVMVWLVLEGNATTGQTDIVARRFTLADVEGVATLTFDDASEWLVNEVTTDDQFQCRVAIDDDGRFMVVWQDDDKNLYGRPFDTDGTGLAQFQINPTIVGLETYYAPQVAVDKDAEGNMDFVISYVYNPDVDTNGQDNHVLAVLGSALSAAPQVMGDLDHDGDVDIFDWAIFQPNYGKLIGAVYDEGDLDEDGDVDIFDWAIFQPMYGFGTGGEPVPEPVTLILLAAGSATMILRRRRS